MRVLFVVNTLPPHDLSGVGEQVVQLVSGLQQLGVETQILGRDPGAVRWPKLLFPIGVVPALKRRLQTFQPDIVQVHESDAGLAVRWLFPPRRQSQKPALIALQQVSYVEERRAVRTLVFQGQKLERPGLQELIFRFFKAPIQVLLGRWTAQGVDLVLAPSQQTALELVRDYGARRVEVLPNTSAGPGAEPISVSVPVPEEGFLLFVGRLRFRKGVGVLLEALRLLKERGVSIPLVVAGEGEHRSSLEKRAGRLGIREQILWLGRANRGQVRYLLERAVLLAVPSIYEGMPLVILEAFAMGVPVVASAVSGIPEVLEASGGGWLVPSGDPEAMAQVLALAWQDRELCRARGRQGREYVQGKLDPKQVALRWLELVKPLVGEAR